MKYVNIALVYISHDYAVSLFTGYKKAAVPVSTEANMWFFSVLAISVLITVLVSVYDRRLNRTSKLACYAVEFGCWLLMMHLYFTAFTDYMVAG